MKQIQFEKIYVVITSSSTLADSDILNSWPTQIQNPHGALEVFIDSSESFQAIIGRRKQENAVEETLKHWSHRTKTTDKSQQLSSYCVDIPEIEIHQLKDSGTLGYISNGATQTIKHNPSELN